MVAARLTGSGMAPVMPAEPYRQAANGVARFEAALRFDVPLPEVVDASGALAGWDTTEAALAQLPYALKVAVYCRNDAQRTHMQYGACAVPLRTVVLRGGVQGQVAIGPTVNMRLSV